MSVFCVFCHSTWKICSDLQAEHLILMSLKWWILFTAVGDVWHLMESFLHKKPKDLWVCAAKSEFQQSIKWVYVKLNFCTNNSSFLVFKRKTNLSDSWYAHNYKRFRFMLASQTVNRTVQWKNRLCSQWCLQRTFYRLVWLFPRI